MKTALQHFRICALFLVTIFGLCHCTSLPSERKAQIKRVLVLSQVPPEVTRYHVGVTVITNTEGNTSPLPELVPHLEGEVRKILSRRLPDAQVVFDAAGAKGVSGYRDSPEFTSAITRLATKAGADTVLWISCVKWAPTGLPGYMQAQTGIWHRGAFERAAAMTDLCLLPILFDARTVQVIGKGWPFGGATPVHMVWKEKFADYSA
ncbi:MAG: hypothetical protein JWO08_1997, partial [Verrucomicrobiaceae bacterium]|nr:hypothetical protein [Verrucomicrobiaceae bacterium]